MITIKKHVRSILHILIMLLFCTSASAQTSLYAEGADISSAIGSPTYVIPSAAGTYTVSGGLATPGDGQDYFQVTVPSGYQITTASYQVTGAGGFNGSWGFAGCCGAGISGNGSGTFSGAAYPLSAGTYGVQMAANFSTGNSWTVTIVVASAATPAPSITSHPSSTSTCPGGNASFTVGASNATSYQWEESTNGGGAWSNVTNGGIYGGATTTTLSITGTNVGMNGYLYRCVATGSTAPPATSNNAALTVNTAPSITSNPSGTVICAGNNTSFSVTATNATSYQWEVSTNGGGAWSTVSNGGVYTNATTATLNITGATAGMNGYQYRCVASGNCTPSATSSGATMTVNSPLSITAQPSNSSICDGSNTSFSVTATGTGLTYQWQVSTNGGGAWSNLTNTGIYTNTTTATLNLTGATTAVSTYQYRCVVDGNCSTPTNSNAATLTINVAPTVNTHPNSTTICAQDNASFTVAASGGNNLTYQWEVSTNGGGAWSNVTNGGVYTNATTATLNITAAPNTMSGYQYRCVVSGCAPSTTSNVATLTVRTLPTVFTQPNNSTICTGGNTSFTVGATATGISRQWQVSTNGGGTWSNVNNGGIYSGATTATLTLTGATTAEHNYQYRCNISGTCTPAVNSNAATLTIETPPAITSHGVNRTICVGDNTTFDVTATGSNLTYLWQVSTNSGTTWSTVNNGGVYSNATTASLTITGATAAMGGAFYRCVISGSCTPSATTAARILIVNTLPSVSFNPTDQTICTGATATFNVSAAGSALTFQWEVSTNGGGTWSNVTNGGVYANATTQTLSVTPNNNSYHTYQYRCVVSGACTPSATSSAATLNVYDPSSITTQPPNTSVCVGSNATITTVVAGTGLTYQWQVSTNGGTSWTVVNTAPYSNFNTASLTITSATLSMNNYQYRCVITSPCAPTLTTNASVLTVNTLPAVTGQPGNATVCVGSTTMMSVTATGTALTYQWEVSTNGGGTWSNVTNGGVYANATTNTLSITPNNNSYHTYQYRCVVSGTCTPSATSSAATLNVYDPTNITTQPPNTSVCAGSNTTITTVVAGDNLSYQWEVSTNGGTSWTVVNTAPYSNFNTASLTITGATLSLSGYQYRCVVTSPCAPTATTTAATLTVNSLPAITGQPSDATVCVGSTTMISVTATGTALTYMWQVSTNGGGTWSTVNNGGVYANATTSSLSITPNNNSYHTYQYRCIVGGACTPSAPSNAVTLNVYIPTSITTQPPNTAICEGSNGTITAVVAGTGLTYQWQVSSNGGTTWSNITGGPYTNFTTASLGLTSVPLTRNGYQYRCVITSPCAATATTNAVTLTVNSLPAVNTHPVNATICRPSNTSFSVSASGTGLTYRWQVSTNGGGTWSNLNNGGVYSGVTNATLSLSSPSTSYHNYQYRCVVSGACTPSATSNAATLSVYNPPAITGNPSNRFICDGNNTTFTCNATGSNLTYQWQLFTGGSWNNLINGTSGYTYSGATSSTLSISNVLLSMNGNQYRCVVSGSSPCTPATTSSATLTVYPILTPAVTIAVSDSDICVNTQVTFTVTSTTNPGTNPSFQWKRNGSNVGGNSTSYTTSSLSNGDVVTCVMTSSVPCPSPSANTTSNSITMTVHPRPVPSITISGPPGDSVCDTRTATFMVTNTTNGGSSPSYLWTKNGTSTGVTTTTYATNTLVNNDVIRCQLTSNALCATPATVTSSSIKMKVTPLTFSTIRIQVTPSTTICEGDTVTVLSFFTNAGTNPTFDWYVNSTKVPNNPWASYTTDAFKDKDTVECILTNSFSCPEPALSGKWIMSVNKTQTSSVSIAASTGSIIIPGVSTTFTATTVNAGPNPLFIWRKNGQQIPGAGGPVYTTSDLVLGDKIDVAMKSDWPCKVNEYDHSNILEVNTPTAVTTVSGQQEELNLYPNPNKGIFQLTGTFDKANTEAKISIFNKIGQKVYETDAAIVSGKLNHKLELSNQLTGGTYIVTINVDGKLYNKRFTIIE